MRNTYALSFYSHFPWNEKVPNLRMCLGETETIVHFNYILSLGPKPDVLCRNVSQWDGLESKHHSLDYNKYDA